MKFVTDCALNAVKSVNKKTVFSKRKILGNKKIFFSAHETVLKNWSKINISSKKSTKNATRPYDVHSDRF